MIRNKYNEAKEAKRLAVFVPGVGVVSETFIKRHMFDLLPGQTAVVCSTIVGNTHEYFDRRAPLHCTSQKKNYWWNKCWENIFRGHFLASMHSARWFLRRQGVQVVMGEYLDSSLPIFRICRASGIPFFVHAHGHDVSLRLRDSFYRDAYLEYNNAAGVITMSRHSRDVLVKLGLNERKIHVIPYGVDVPEKVTLRSETGTVKCFSIGRMVGKKAPLLVLESFRRALKKNDSLRLTMAGDGPLLVAAQHFVHCQGLQSRVSLVGAIPSKNVAALLESADIFLQHSVVDLVTGDSEGMPVAILEAMAHGLPVVSTQHAGIPEAVCEGETGILVAEMDVDGMADAIGLLAADRPLREKMGTAGHARVQSHFTWMSERRELRKVLGLDQQQF